MVGKLNLENILFLDIETVPEIQHYSQLDEIKQSLWELKSQYQRKDELGDNLQNSFMPQRTRIDSVLLDREFQTSQAGCIRRVTRF